MPIFINHKTRPGLGVDKLVIGGAKHDSTKFTSASHKALNSLVDIAAANRSDAVILACMVDSHDRLDQARKYLEHHFNKVPYHLLVETYQVAGPMYFNFSGGRYFHC